MLFRRIYQFLIVYAIGLSFLMAIKKMAGLSNYVIPGIPLILDTAQNVALVFFHDVIRVEYSVPLNKLYFGHHVSVDSEDNVKAVPVSIPGDVRNGLLTTAISGAHIAVLAYK